MREASLPVSNGMKTLQEIYAEYNVMPSLQLHQLRVAAVAKIICDNLGKSLDERTVVLACLFHDMGNIIKADLVYFPEFVEPKGLEYWERIKAEFVAKYGTNHHAANVAIAREIGLPNASITLIDSISFSQLAEVVADDSYERKVMQYADIRVGPHGVLSLKERLLEGKERYRATRTERPYYETDKELEHLARAAEQLEQQVFAKARITPEGITDKAIESIIEELREYPIA